MKTSWREPVLDRVAVKVCQDTPKMIAHLHNSEFWREAQLIDPSCISYSMFQETCLGTWRLGEWRFNRASDLSL